MRGAKQHDISRKLGCVTQRSRLAGEERVAHVLCYLLGHATASFYVVAVGGCIGAWVGVAVEVGGGMEARTGDALLRGYFVRVSADPGAAQPFGAQLVRD